MNLIVRKEEDRIFCGHSIEHLLDVARLTYIFNLEQQAGLDKEMIYAAALLHDIGRGRQYTDGTPHHLAGEGLAESILKACSFSAEEQQVILQAIASHRNEAASKGNLLAELLYRADKQSRNCFACGAADECNWTEEKKNSTIEY